MNEFAIPSTEARNNFSQLVACAMWGDSRIVLRRHKFEMAAIIGIGDLMRLRQLDREEKKPVQPLEPARCEPTTRYEMLRDQYLRGLDVESEGRNDEDFNRLVTEIGMICERGEDPRVVLARA
jgi:hypothetical protein